MHFGHAVGIATGLPSSETVCFEKLDVRGEDEPDFGKPIRSDARSAQNGRSSHGWPRDHAFDGARAGADGSACASSLRWGVCRLTQQRAPSFEPLAKSTHAWPTERRGRSNFQSWMPTLIMKEVTAGAVPIRTQVPLTRERLKRRIPLYHY